MTRVLVADDEAILAESTAELLRAAGHEAASVGRVEDILPALLRHGSDVLLQDVRMPGMELDVHLRRLRGHDGLRKLRVILFTATVGVDSLRHHPLINAFLAKPFDADVLLALVGDLPAPRP